jgi:hypothetical protein
MAAHVLGAGTKVIYLDVPFWHQPFEPSAARKDSQVGTIIHELLHLATAIDIAPEAAGYGTTEFFKAALGLASRFPEWAVWNANNHEFYYMDL